MYQQLCGLLCHAEDEILKSDGVVAPYCSTLTRVAAFFYASTVFLAVVLYLPHIFLCVVIDKRSGCAHTASHSVTHSSTESSSRAADGQDDKGRTLAQAKAHLHMMSACHIPHTGIF